MLGGGQDEILLVRVGAFDEGLHLCRHSLRILAKRADVDDRVIGIVVDIGDGRVDPVNPNGAGFERGDFAHGVSVAGISGGGKGHRGRKRSAFIQAHRGAALKIGADEQRQF